MTSNQYIISNDFYIMNDLNSFMIYFDYFISPNLPLTKFIRITSLRRRAYTTLRTVVIILFLLQIYKLRYKITYLEDSAILIFKGSGKWSNRIKLKKRKNRIIVKKTVFSKKIFEKEKNFYNKYKRNDSKIFLPKSKFIAPNIIEMEFINMDNFNKLIVNGKFDLKTSLKHFNNIKNELTLLYKKDPALIHGDLWPTNIFVDNEKYYLIDFSESFVYSPKYDFYVLLYSILHTFKFIPNNETSLANLINKRISVLDMLQIKPEELKKIEKQFNKYRLKRFSKV